MEKIILTEEEINKIKGLREQFNNLVNVVGNVEIQIMDLQLQKEQLKIDLSQLQQRESIVIREIEDKYGKGTISLESNEFLPKN